MKTGLFGNILKTGFDILTTPVDVVKDVITLGGALTDEESALVKKANTLEKDLEDVRESLEDL